MPRMLETGVDIVEIGRIADLARRFGDRFGRRVYSADEWRQWRDRPASLAARFAAKEATIKALGTREIALHEIRVVRPTDARPTLELRGRARARADALGVRQLALSLSHSREYAVAVVVLERA
jgi:holo-[acyl-carrier protein] synthase